MQTRTLIKKLLWPLLLVAVIATAGTISRIHTFSDGDILTASDLNAEFDNIVDGVNSITDDNISSGAAISPLKLSAAIAGAGITRNTSTGTLTPTVDDVTIEVGGSGLQIIDGSIGTAQIDAAVAGLGLGVNGTAVDVQVDGSTLEINSDTLRIKDGGVTQVKRVALGQQISSSSGAFVTASSTFVDVTNLSVSITTTGRPVVISLISDGSANPCDVRGFTTSSAAIPVHEFRFLEGSTEIAVFTWGDDDVTGTSTNPSEPCSAFHHLYPVAAGTYTFKFQARKTNGASNLRTGVNYAKLVAYEL